MAKALLFVERMMEEQDMMQPHWGGHFQAAWRKGLAKCTDSRQVIMYLAALQVRSALSCWFRQGSASFLMPKRTWSCCCF